MKLCAVCDKIVRNPQHCLPVKDIAHYAVVCEEHKDSVLDLADLYSKIHKRQGIESWDYLWQGLGVT